MDSGPALFYESLQDALREDARALAGGSRAWAKVVGRLLKPEIADPEVAARWLDDRLNPNRRERLTDDQERYLMRESARARGWSAALCYICDEAGFERPKRRDPAEERDRVLDVIEHTSRALTRALDE